MMMESRRAQRHVAAITPAVVAMFGAKCVRVSSRLDVIMKNEEQEDLLRAPGLRQTLLEYCMEAHRRGTEDRSHFPLTELYWIGDHSTGVVKVLGPKRGGVVYNLIDTARRVVDDRTPHLEKVHPFGRGLQGSPWVVFLDIGKVAHRDSTGFRFGRVVGGDEKVYLIDSGHARFRVPLALVAPGIAASGNVDTTDATRHIPPVGKLAMERLEALKVACAHDEYIMLILRNALTAVEATGIAAQGAQVASKLQHSARALRGAARYLRGGLGTCTSRTSQQDMDAVANDLELLSCRVRVAEVTSRPEILHSPTDEVFYRQLLDIEEERGHEAEVLQTVAACLSTLASVRSTLTSRLRKQGLAGERHRVADEDFSNVVAACQASGAATQHLARMAREKTTDPKEWKTALSLGRGNTAQRLSDRCAGAAEELVRKIEASACRSLYRSVLSAYGRERNNLRDESNSSLAREVAVLLESSGHGQHFDDATLAKCILDEDRDISGHVEARLRAAQPNPYGKDTSDRIDEFELKTRSSIKAKQAALVGACERSESAPNNALAPASSALLGPLLAKEGRVELLKLMQAIPEVEELLARSTENETVKQETARHNCAETVKDFELDVRQRLCRLRLMRRLQMPPPSSDQQLAKHWLHRSERGDFVAGEEKEVDKLCVHTLDAEGAKIHQRAALVSARSCPDAKIKMALEHFCAAIASSSIPVNFLDFLSLLLLCALPRWPTSSVVMSSLWLQERKRGLGPQGDERTCASTAEIIQIHGIGAERESEGHAALRNALIPVLTALESGMELEALSKCACSSPGVLTSTVRQNLSRATKWYWEAGSAIMAQGQGDASLVTEARQIMVTDALAASLKHVSWSGRATLKEPRKPILQVLWMSYLNQMFKGPLRIFLGRIMTTYKDRRCQLAMVDTFFFVVALDLIDVSRQRAVSQDAFIADVAARMSLTRSGVAQAALAVAAAAGLAGVAVSSTGLGALLGTTAVGAAKAAAKFGASAAGIAFAQKLAGEAYKRHLEPQSFSKRFGAKKTEREGILTSAYNQLFSSAFFSRKSAVTDVLLQLCSRAMDESAHLALVPDQDPSVRSNLRVEHWEKCQRKRQMS